MATESHLVPELVSQLGKAKELVSASETGLAEALASVSELESTLGMAKELVTEWRSMVARELALVKEVESELASESE